MLLSLAIPVAFATDIAEEWEPHSHADRTPRDILNSADSLNISLDSKGSVPSQRGEDDFLPEAGVLASGDENWWGGFGGTALEDDVLDAVHYNGELIVCGYFQNAGGVSNTNGLAAWDGSRWRSIWTVNPLIVYSVEVFQGELYVGGAFYSVGGAITDHLLRWNGIQWQPVGAAPPSGSGADVSCMRAIGSSLIVGGGFTSIGGVAANRIAAWNGTSWSPLGSGLNSSIQDITSFQGQPVACGLFTQSGTTPVSKIALWNGTSWAPIGAGFNGDLTSVVQYGPDLIAAGYFTQSGSTPLLRIARWDGTQWNDIGSGLHNGVGNALAVVNGELWVGGSFLSVSGVTARALARWDGSTWRGFGTGPAYDLGNGYVSCISAIGDSAIIGGLFQNVDGAEAANLALWTDDQWSSPMSNYGMGCNTSVDAFVEYQGMFIVGGSFTRVGHNAWQGLARWDGSAWHNVGVANSGILCLTLHNGYLYAGGAFTQIGGVSASRVARWDGVTWQPVGTGTSGTVYCMTSVGNDLYLGGIFTTAGGIPANRIAKWDGTTWSALGSGMSGGAQAAVRAIASYGGDIYAGGKFTTAGDGTINSFARWNGSTWSSVGGGLQGGTLGPVVYALLVNNGVLTVAGDFYETGGVSNTFVAYWDGAIWGAYGPGRSLSCRSLVIHDGFLTAGGSSSQGLLDRWDGAAWVPLSSNLDSAIYELYSLGPFLYAGGTFSIAGGKSSIGIARWTDDISGTDTPRIDVSALQAAPNPFAFATHISIRGDDLTPIAAEIFDVRGRRVYHHAILPSRSFGVYELRWTGVDDSGRPVANGAYFVRLADAAGRTVTGRVVLAR